LVWISPGDGAARTNLPSRGYPPRGGRVPGGPERGVKKGPGLEKKSGLETVGWRLGWGGPHWGVWFSSLLGKPPLALFLALPPPVGQIGKPATHAGTGVSR